MTYEDVTLYPFEHSYSHWLRNEVTPLLHKFVQNLLQICT